ncbi:MULTISPECIES: cephalosporin hydroxylase family protein [unclassified Methylophilus]|uniref:cephalosporin hydroxylase family protein n=1 Tax=unclassified Methylophilus TaxID=2630143 RepID=UPI00037E9E7D|nr:MULTISPECIES: cephalosporin hydroxylase family protein [unclassified Methylophilus]
MNPIEQFELEKAQRIDQLSNDNAFKELSRNWVEQSMRKSYVYNFSWMGRPVIQYPQDMMAMQELVWEVKPDLIIETGIAHGGSLIMNASYLAMLDYCDSLESGIPLDPKAPKRRVLGLDIDIREHNKKAIEAHPMSHRIDMIQGSSIDASTIEQVKSYSKNYQRILVCLDSNHTHDHVLAELNAYASLVSIGSYCVVFDTFVEDVPKDVFTNRPWEPGNNPKTAVWDFLDKNQNFSIDKTIQNKLQITVAPDGFLKRIR